MSPGDQPVKSSQQLIKIIAIPVILAGLTFLTIGAIDILKPRQYIGEIFGKRITQSKFDAAHKYNRLQSLIRYGKAFESIEPLLDLDAEAWDQLLLLEEAKNKKIKVTDKDVVNEIAQYPYFFRNDKFDSLLYRDIIRNSLKAEPKEFEESVRQSLLVERLRDHVTGTINPSNEELLAEFRKRRDLVEAQYAIIDHTPFLEGLTSSDEELRAYFGAHPDEFETGESVKIQYVRLPFPPDGGVQKQVETKFKARAIIDRYTKNNLPLKDAAEGMKFELKETGFFTTDNAPQDIGIDWTPEAIKNTFRMKKDEISQPLEQKTGYAVIKMIDKKEAHIPAFEEVKDQVTEKLHAEKARGLAAKKTEEHINQITPLMQAGTDFKTAATGLGLEIKDEALSQRESMMADLGIQDDSADAFTKISANTIGPVIQADQGALIVFIDKITPSSAFEKNAKSFRELVIREKKDKIFENFLKDLHKKANIKKY